MSVSFSKVMDDAPIGRLQWLIAILLTAVMVLEGLDFQVAAYSAPALMKEWHIGKPATAPLLAAATIGTALGTLVGSWTADRFGRKPTIVASVAFFGLMTVICASAGNPQRFGVFRLLSGLGLGAAFPVATAMMREWMPRRASAKAISILTIGIPAGVLLGAVIGSWLLPSVGWRNYFISIGALCVVTTLVLLIALPESPGFLILKGRHREVHRLLARAGKNLGGPDHEVFEVNRADRVEGYLFGATGLLARDNLRTNTGLWVAFFCGSLATYAIAAWLTVLLVDLHLPLATALRGPIAYSSSAIIGSLGVGWLIARLGSRVVVSVLAFLGIAAAVMMSIASYVLTPGPLFFWILFPGLAIAGFCIGSLMAIYLVLAAEAYETRLRTTGIGLMYAIGRGGAILSSFVGGAVLAAALPAGFFIMIAALVVAMLAGSLIVDRHIGSTDRSSRLLAPVT